MRLAGKRDLAELNTFDLVVMLLLSNVVQNAVIGNDNSLVGGLLGAAVLIVVNAVTVRIGYSRPALTRLMEGEPTVLVRDGKMVANLHRLGLRRTDVAAALRRQGAGDISEVRQAVLGPGGAIVVDLVQDAQDVTNAQLKAENAKLVAELREEIRQVRVQLDAGFAELRREP